MGANVNLYIYNINMPPLASTWIPPWLESQLNGAYCQPALAIYENNHVNIIHINCCKLNFQVEAKFWFTYVRKVSISSQALCKNVHKIILNGLIALLDVSFIFKLVDVSC